MLGVLDDSYDDVSVVGAGIAGLLAAYALDRAGYVVTLYEEKNHAGGLIETRQTPFGIAERAAHSFLLTPTLQSLCDGLGVASVRLHPESKARWIWRDGKMHRFPLRPTEVGSLLFRSLCVPAQKNTTASETVEHWAKRHLGKAAHDYLLAPFLAGIHGSTPGEIGVQAAFPEIVPRTGLPLLPSLLLNRFSGKRRHGRPDRRPVLSAPREGMGALVRALEQHLGRHLGERFRRGQRVDALPDTPNLVLAVPADRAAKLLDPEDPILSRKLSGVHYVPLVSVTAFLPKNAFPKPPRGVGVLFPPRENRKCLGILFNSSALENRVRDPDTVCACTIMLGGSRHPQAVDWNEMQIQDQVLQELGAALQLRGSPLHLEIFRHPRAIPQYSPALPAVWQAARSGWCARPGHILFGNYTGQISIRSMAEEAMRSLEGGNVS